MICEAICSGCGVARPSVVGGGGMVQVTQEDIFKVMPLCLRHRLRKDPLEQIDSGEKVTPLFPPPPTCHHHAPPYPGPLRKTLHPESEDMQAGGWGKRWHIHPSLQRLQTRLAHPAQFLASPARCQATCPAVNGLLSSAAI